MRVRSRFLLIVAALALSAGCASLLLTGAGGGIEYTFTNIAYKTVSYPIGEVHSSMHKALQRMGIKELSLYKTGKKIEIVSATNELKIYIHLEWITNSATKITVDARRNIILKDKATATEIIEQTEMILNRRAGIAP